MVSGLTITRQEILIKNMNDDRYRLRFKFIRFEIRNEIKKIKF